MTGEDRRIGPGELVMASVVRIGRLLEQAADVDDYLNTPIVVPAIREETGRTALDDALDRHLRALTSVCAKPHDRLDTERLLVRAEQARRVPVAGLIRLAEHSEDWAELRSGNVHPARLLAQRNVEDFDFYENRLAVQLIDHLRQYVSRRINTLEKLKRHIADLQRYEGALHERHLSHWTRARLANVLAGAASRAAAQAEPIEDELRWMLKTRERVNAHRGYALYRLAKRQVPVPLELRRTNLLSGDRHYHDVALLWKAWAQRWTRESQALRTHEHEFAHAYAAYTRAITLRACRDLGLAPMDPRASLCDGATIDIGDSSGIRLTLHSPHEGTIELLADDQPVTRIIAVPDDLTRGGSVADAEVAAAALVSQFEDARVPTIVAYPGETVDRHVLPAVLQQFLHWAGPFPSATAPRLLYGVIPVTPLEIESTERMSRALRWSWYATWALDAYPARIPAPVQRRLSGREWLRAAQPQWEMLRPPTVSEIDELQRELDQQSGRRPAQPTAEQPAHADIRVPLASALDVLAQLRACPFCHQSARTFTPRDLDTFHCRCDCGGQWGTRPCGTCKRAFPVLWSGAAVKIVAGGDADPYASGDRIDSLFGSEVLALPCPSFADWSRFRCPWCGVCQGAPTCACVVTFSTATPGGNLE